MDLAREYGYDAARAVLGQKSIDSTEHYDEIDQGHAQDVTLDGSGDADDLRTMPMMSALRQRSAATERVLP